MQTNTDEIAEIIERTVEITLEHRADSMRALTNLVEKHERILYGDGREGGLLTVVDRLERVVDGINGIGRKVIEALIIAGVMGLIILLAKFGLLSG